MKTLHQSYRSARSAGYAPVPAMRFARLDMATQAAERLGRVDFYWEDEPWEIGGADEEVEDDIVRGLETGLYTCQSVIASHSINPDDPREGGEVLASLSQIVTSDDLAGMVYQRLIECELATEAGVIETLPHPWCNAGVTP